MIRVVLHVVSRCDSRLSTHHLCDVRYFHLCFWVQHVETITRLAITRQLVE
ncbi:Uncharacterised protein [Vibrio cholerae]|nr:Uncharacterised protein [Vibrio cholerae]